MANCAFGWPVYSDVGVSFSPTFSGGSWSGSLPLANLQDRRLSKLARSTDATSANTTFDIDLGTARSVGIMAVFIPNLTKSAVPTIQWKLANVSDFSSTVYNSGAVQAWPTGVTAEDANGLNVWITTIPTNATSARYARCAIVDTANADGHIDVARVLVCGRYVPTANFSLGSRMTLESDTVRTVTDGGAVIFRAKPVRRGHVISLANIAESEAIPSPWKLSRQLGSSGQLFFVYDTADTYMYERAFLATLRQLSPLENPDYRYQMSFDIVEEL